MADRALGVWSMGVIANPSNPDYVIPLLVEEVTGPFVTGVVMASAVASLMPTTDSVVLTLGSMASRGIYRKYLNHDADEAREVGVGQAILLVVLGVSLVFSFFQPAGIFSLAEFAVAGFAATAPALFLSLYWQRATKVGAMASMVVATPVMVGFFSGSIPATYRFGLHYGFVGLVVSAPVFVVASWVTSIPSSNTVRSFVKSAD